MDENQSNKIKVLNVFQNEGIAENTEKFRYSNKFEFEKGIIRNAIVSTHTSKCTKLEEKDKEKKNCIIFREQCEYCLTNFSVSGHLILTKESLLFEPDLRDKNVITYGLGTYQIFIDLYDIYECAHIVVPTKDTYLYNNEDTCGFIQVLLKSIYSGICDDSLHKRSSSSSSAFYNLHNENGTDDINKQKSISYYKYISKSLSYVFNLAHPLVQNTSLKDYKNDQVDNATNFTTDISKHSENYSERNEDENSQLVKKKKNSFINFDMSSPKNNIVDHLHDRDLKIYQEINETNYSEAISSHPNITYKNSLNVANNCNYSPRFGDNSFEFRKAKEASVNVTKDGSLKEERVVTSGELKNWGVAQDSRGNEAYVKNDLANNFFPNDDNRTNETLKQGKKGEWNDHINSSGKNYNCDEQRSKRCVEDIVKREDNINLVNEAQLSHSKTLKNISFELHHKVVNNVVNGDQHMKGQSNNKLYEHAENNNVLYKKPYHKKYEEKCFILFRFFNNNKAYETTTKIIKEIDEVRKSENKIKKTITSVPFTSNELLRCIIKQSLIDKDPKKKIQIQSSANDIKDLKNLALIPKLEYISGCVKLLSKEMTKEINYYLPPTLSIKIWKLAFCSSIHGVSFKTLYRSVLNKGSVILLIYDMDNVLFGCFLDKLHCDNCYYGSGENFLFTFKDKKQDKIKDGKMKIGKDDDNSSTYNRSLDDFNKSEENYEKVKRKDTSLEINDINSPNNNSKDTNSNDKFTTYFEDSSKEMTKGYSNQETGTPESAEYMSRQKTDIHDCNDDVEVGCCDNEDDDRDDDDDGEGDYNGASKKGNNYRTKTLNEEKCDVLMKKQNNKLHEQHASSNNTKSGLCENSNNSNNDKHSSGNSSIQVYAWTTKNNYFVYSDEKSITVGGGDNYALVINEDLCKGQTNRSNTYDNDLLTYDDEFEIQFLQLWIFDDS
ncbi:TLD domain-containing protein [Plasmodium ovale curtisi]|uniref:Oxidation resistance protein 1 n=1 Tax=Plasmodium ovale curtisi TaxID=864141 RepID=A0A1A8WLC8_PLAOA|nr:TLD domain-containing protein [Plasmodium ovale curtisi]